MIGVQDGIDGRIDVWQDDREVEHRQRYVHRGTEGEHTVDGVQGEPAEHEEEDYDWEIFGRLYLTPGRVKVLKRKAQHEKMRQRKKKDITKIIAVE